MKNIKILYWQLCLAFCLVLNILLLLTLLTSVFKTFGIIFRAETDGNNISSLVEILMNLMVPIVFLAHAAAIALLRTCDYGRIRASIISSSALFVLLVISSLCFGDWFFSIRLEGIVKFSDRVWWLF